MGVVGTIMIMVGLPTALLDRGMNGQYARWAPWGLGMAIVGLLMASV